MKRPSALLVIGACFLGSGLFRVWDAGQAIAAEVAATATNDAMDLSQCPPPMEPASMLAAFRERETQLNSMELQLANREQVLRVAKIKIEEQIAELVGAEARLSETLAQVDGAAEGDISRITAVYENMKPAKAAELFQAMDIEFASNFLIRMNPDAAAAILSSLEPETAYSISVMMATRNAGVPKQ